MKSIGLIWGIGSLKDLHDTVDSIALEATKLKKGLLAVSIGSMLGDALPAVRPTTDTVKPVSTFQTWPSLKILDLLLNCKPRVFGTLCKRDVEPALHGMSELSVKVS